MYNIIQIAQQTNANWLQQLRNDDLIEHLLIDSRKLLFSESSLFFALSSPRRNGNDFIPELYVKGLRNFVVDSDFLLTDIVKYPDANILQVKDVLQALQMLAIYHRKQFQFPIIGITGSNGKTIVKEWLYQLLHANYNIVRSPKSYNSQIGVPLSLWQINTQHTLGIFEAGISKPDEMHCLQKMIAPTIGVFTNIGEAHSEGYLNIRQKINEKLQLFRPCEVLVYRADNQELEQAIMLFFNKIKNHNDIQLFCWGSNKENDLQIISIIKSNDSSTITGNYTNKLHTIEDTIFITIPFTDDASIENAINCWCVLLYLNIADKQIIAGMQQLKPVEMRLELKKGINNCSVINDSYSADINSLGIALDFLTQQQQHQNRTVILSDILQSGKSNLDLYTAVAAMLQQKKITRFIGIGPAIASSKDAFSGIPKSIFLDSVAAFRQQFDQLHFNNETILLKGARVFEFEQISHLLEEKVHQTVLEINLSAISHNLKMYQQLLKPTVKLMAMVKAFSYGSGSYEIANLLQFHKVDYLTVAFTDEGVALRKAGISLPIMVMSPEEITFEALVAYNLEPELYSFTILKAFHQYLANIGLEYYPVHIKLDTGMHRLGFELKEMEHLKQLLPQLNRLKVQTVFSHLVGSDNSALDDFTKKQANDFENACQQLQLVLSYPFIRHLANTSAIARHSNLQYEMVRLGIGLYGVSSNKAMQTKLQNVTTLKTRIAQLKHIKAGDTVGYNRNGKVNIDSIIATVRIGYADGYPRLLSNGNGKMLVNGHLAPVIGNVCMDMTMLDVTGIPNVKEGGQVIVFGKELPVNNLGIWANTIGYEILAGISQRVKRIYFEE